LGKQTQTENVTTNGELHLNPNHVKILFVSLKKNLVDQRTLRTSCVRENRRVSPFGEVKWYKKNSFFEQDHFNYFSIQVIELNRLNDVMI